MKKIPNWLLLSIVLVVLLALKFIFFPKKNEIKKDANQKNKAAISVNFFVSKKQKLVSPLLVAGQTGAINSVDIIPEIGGKVISIFFEEGQQVSKGTPLLKINDADLQAQLLKTQTQIRLSEQKLERVKKLLNAKGVSQEEYDIQETEVNSLKADENFINSQIAKTNISAPFDGVLGLKKVSVGSFVNTNTPIISLVQMKPIYVEFSVPEKYFNLIKTGMNVSFQSEKNSHKDSCSAKVYAIEPAIEQMTKTIKARALYSGNEIFYPGNFVDVKLNFLTSDSAITVPTQCIIPGLKSQKVFIAKNNSAKEVQVKTGIRLDDNIQITEGVSKGDTLITTGLMSLKNDFPVKLINTKK